MARLSLLLTFDDGGIPPHPWRVILALLIIAVAVVAVIYVRAVS